MHANNELISTLARWSNPPARKGDGVIVGCTANFEWLLAWWWMNYQMHNIEYPVTFFDFGDMSPVAKEWCKKRGELKSLPIRIHRKYSSSKKKLLPLVLDEIGNAYDIDVWQARWRGLQSLTLAFSLPMKERYG